jgi:hypothetical protein
MADLSNLVGRLSRVQPSEEFYKFTDMQLRDEILDALTVYKPEYTIEELPREEEHLVLWKAMSSCYFLLAGKHAENFRFKVQNDEYHGQQVGPQYVALAEKYEKMYNENRGIDVNTVTRRQTGTGLKAPYYSGDTP